jgi:desulfoferrodoxin (superoxide reductase-like protein)
VDASGREHHIETVDGFDAAPTIGLVKPLDGDASLHRRTACGGWVGKTRVTMRIIASALAGRGMPGKRIERTIIVRTDKARPMPGPIWMRRVGCLGDKLKYLTHKAEEGIDMLRKTLLMMMFLLLAGWVQAHPPSDIQLTTQDHIVTIKVLHHTTDPLKHFIFEVQVSQNDKLVVKQTFNQQSDADAQDALYTIPSLKAGDTLTVKATCNIFGSKTKKFIVKK